MKKLLIVMLFWIPVLAFGQSQEQHYKIYDVKQKKTISIDELIANTHNIDVLFFGEEHNDSIGHILEFELLKKLSSSYPKTALALEMFHTDTQPVMNEYLAGLISEKNFSKEARTWSNYKDYRPMIEFTKASQLPVIAGNAASRYSNAVTKSGLEALKQFPAASLAFLPPIPVDTATGRYHEKFIETLGGHDMGPMKIYQTQNLWDASMAWSIAKYYKANKRTKIFQINGRFHSDEKLGTLAKLQQYLPKLRISNISCFSGDDYENPNWNKHENLGDYIILTDPKIKRSF